MRTLAERADVEPGLEPLLASGWPRFMRESPIDRAYWERLLRDLPDYQVVLTDGEDRLLGAGHSIPFRWRPQSPDLPGGWDEVFSEAVADADAGRVPTAAAALVDHHGRRRAWTGP